MGKFSPAKASALENGAKVRTNQGSIQLDAENLSMTSDEVMTTQRTKSILLAASAPCVLILYTLQPCAYAEPVGKGGISFSLPFGTSLNGGLALADNFKAGLNVVVVGAKICKARTGAKFVYEVGGVGAPPMPEPGIPAGEGNYRFWATDVVGYGKCGPLAPNVAIIGAEAIAVNVISPERVRTRIPKGIELKARRLLLAREAAKKDHVYGPLSDECPKAFRTKEGMLLDLAGRMREIMDLQCGLEIIIFSCFPGCVGSSTDSFP